MNASFIHCGSFTRLPLSHVFGQFMGLWIPALLGAELFFSPAAPRFGADRVHSR